MTTTGKAIRIFVSHAHRDNDFAERLAADIEDSQLECWLDLWELQVGDSLRLRVEEGIRTADWLIVVLSVASVSSKWVAVELSMAFVRELEERSVFILPVVIDDCEIPLSLKPKLYADFRSDYAQGLLSLVGRLRNHSPQERARLRRQQRHCARCDDQLPLVAYLLRLLIEVGIPLFEGITMLAKELPNPIADEIAQLVKEIGDLEAAATKAGAEHPSWDPAFRAMADRLPTRRMQLFVSAVILGFNTGALDRLLAEIPLEKEPSGVLL